MQTAARLRVGFIGMGNMASAIVTGGFLSGFFVSEQVSAYDPAPGKLSMLEGTYGITRAASAAQLVRGCDLVVLAVKPNVMPAVVSELMEELPGKAVLSIALGWRYEQLHQVLPASARWQAVMPNTPMQVGEGMCVFEEKNSLLPGELQFVKAMFASMGTIAVMPTSLMSAAGTVTGCGPAFTYLFLEAMADAAVYHGVPRAEAYKLASQTVLGAARMVLETGSHPGLLKDNVCSPGGSTIRGIAMLEQGGLRSAVIEAVREIEGTRR